MGITLQAAALLISSVALLINAAAFRQTSKSKDLEWLFRYLSDMRLMEKQLLESADAAEQSQRFVEFVNHLETCCYAHNAGLFPRRTKVMAGDNLVNSVAIIQCSDVFAARVEAILTSHTTYESLREFCKKHKPAINAAQAQIKAQQAIALEQMSGP